MPDWTSEYTQLIEDCEKRESRLSEWDREFIDSIKKRLANGAQLTPKQIEKLDEIWERATARG